MTHLNRRIPLDGASNFRDFGGYAASGGRVRHGLLFRSDRLSRLTEADLRVLQPLGLRLIIDLRRSSERAQAPTAWYGSDAPRQWHVPLFEDDGAPTSLIQLAADPQSRTAQATAELMRTVYRRLICEPRPQAHFAQILQHLCDEQTPPVVVHCSGGKDRTGVLAALVHSALGVHKDDILEDYMLTAKYYDASHLLRERADQILDTHGATMSDEALAPVFTVQPSYIEAAFEAADTQFGSVSAYLEHLGMDAIAREQLRQLYVE